MTGAAPDLALFIRMDQRAVRMHLLFGLAILFLGVAVIAFGPPLISGDGGRDHDVFFRLAGTLMSLTGFFPFKECWSRKERIEILREIQHDPERFDPETLQNMVTKLYGRFLGL